MSTATPLRLYHSPIGLYEFQAQAVAHGYTRLNNLPVFDTGIGKTHIAMATAAMLFEDGLIDHCLVVAEKNKIEDWVEDFGTYTKLEAKLYHGPRRAKLRHQLPQVVVSTYETVKADVAHKVWVEVGNRKIKRLLPHVLMHTLYGKRWFIIYDEITKLGNRSSGNYKAHELMLRTLRESPAEVRVMGLTATPVEKSPENLFNIGRLLTPSTVGTVESFYNEHVASRDIFGNPSKFKNLDGLVTKLSPVLLRKRKTDPDVVEQFPKQVEEFTFVDLAQRHADFYETVAKTFDNITEWEEKQLFMLMRQIAGHPLSLTRSQGLFAKTIVQEVGEKGLALLGSAKLDRLVDYLRPLVKGQGAQVVIFTFFGQSILPIIRQRLEDEGFSVTVNHGQMTASAQKESERAFNQGQHEIFLSSDAGSRGINLQAASYVVQYELPVTYANYIQRMNRIHRIDSTHESVTCMSFVARKTVEDGICQLIIKRNRWSDILLGDEDGGADFLTANDRRELLKAAKNLTKR